MLLISTYVQPTTEILHLVCYTKVAFILVESGLNTPMLLLMENSRVEYTEGTRVENFQMKGKSNFPMKAQVKGMMLMMVTVVEENQIGAQKRQGELSGKLKLSLGK